MDLYWVGINGAALPLGISNMLLWILGPVGFAKFYSPTTLLLLGICAWLFFRTLELPRGMSVVAALAAALNMNFFSNTCWGLGTRSTALGAAFLALAALNTRKVGNRWLNAALAGLAVGISVIEGADNGVIFSLFIAVFVENETMPARLAGGMRLVLVVLFAVFIAVQVLIPLLGIATKGSTSIASPEKARDPAAQWDFATQWSLPSKESLRVIIPGLFGYRMDTPDGGDYWGRVGEQPGWQQHHQGFPRHSGAENMLVCWSSWWGFGQSPSLCDAAITEHRSSRRRSGNTFGSGLPWELSHSFLPGAGMLRSIASSIPCRSFRVSATR
jgi:hypothetical protein